MSTLKAITPFFDSLGDQFFKNINIDNTNKLISLNFYNPKEEDLPPIKYHRDKERFDNIYSDKLDRFYLYCTVNENNKKELLIDLNFTLKNDSIFYNFKMNDQSKVSSNKTENEKKTENLTKSTVLFMEKKRNLNSDTIFKIDKIKDKNTIILTTEVKEEYLDRNPDRSIKPIYFYFFVQKPITFDFNNNYLIIPAFVNKNDINTDIDQHINDDNLIEKREKLKIKQDFIQEKENNKTRINIQNNNLSNKSNKFNSFTTFHFNLIENYNNNIIKVNNNNISYILPNITITNPNYIQYTFININKYKFKIIKKDMNQTKFIKQIVENAVIKYDDKPLLNNVYCCKYIDKHTIYSTISRTIKNGLIYINDQKYNIDQRQHVIKIISSQVKINNLISPNNNLFINNTKCRCILKKKNNKIEWYILSSF